jgi:misacylated tRNA(Ala) deacylase
MALVQPMPGGRVVGALACQNNSYLQSLKTEVVSCVKYSPPKSESTSKKTKGSKTEAVPDTWLIEFADSVFFPEGMPHYHITEFWLINL